MSDALEVARTARALTGAGRPVEALVLTTPLAALADAPTALLSAHAAALNAVGRGADALPVYRRVTELAPDDRIGWYNYAATLGDLGRAADAERAMGEAIRRGLDRPEVDLVLARAMTLLQRFDEAEDRFGKVLAREPLHPAAHRDLAQLVWMRTGDVARALSGLDAALAGAPGDVALTRTRATVLQFAGDLPAAIATLEAAVARQSHPALLLDLAALRIEAGQGAEALTIARALLAASPGLRPALEVYGQACLAAGEAAEAERIADQLLVGAPFDQMALMLRSTAWRLQGDARADSLIAPDRFVRAHHLPTPDGWTSREAFLTDLRRSAHALHGLAAHPLQQSLRGGSQAQGVLASGDPVIQAFFRSVDRVIADHITWLGEGDDPVRARITGRHRIKGAWSVRLRPHGYHVNHIHPEGWLSSAFYVETPTTAVDAGDRQGWLTFNKPGFATVPALEANHAVRPEPGLLALFPSYMWHGTQAFTTDETRMTIAFDIVPEPL